MRVLVTLGSAADQRGPLTSIVAMPGMVHAVSIKSPWLVSAGQEFVVCLTASLVPDHTPGNQLRHAEALGLVDLNRSHLASHIPSERPLHAILTDVVNHGIENPRHGTDCVCMDKFSREIRRHVWRSVPPVEDLDKDRWTVFDAKSRIAHVLGMVVRSL